VEWRQMIQAQFLHRRIRHQAEELEREAHRPAGVADCHDAYDVVLVVYLTSNL
jgi:hypothetical protein